MRRHIHSSPLAAVLLASLLPAVLADFNLTCPATITNANATGSVVFSDPITQQLSSDLSSTKQYVDDNSHLVANDTTASLTGTNLAYTLSVSTTRVEFNGQQLPSIFSALSASFESVSPFKDADQWAACALPILNLPPLTTRYGQSDTGNCEATLPYGCVEKILKQVLSYKQTVSPHSDGLHDLCADLALDLMNTGLGPDGSDNSVPTLPAECTNLFRADNKGPGPLFSKVKGFPITSPNDTTPFSKDQTYECPSVSSRLSGSSIKSYPFMNISTEYNNDTTIASGGNYDEAIRTVYPIITLFFNGLNHSFFSYVPSVSASMSCVRINDFSQGSRVSAQLEPATAPSLGLSTGAKVGIALAVIVAVLVAAGLVWALFLRKRQAGARKDYGQPKWYQSPVEVFKRRGVNTQGMEKSEYEMMTK